MNTAYQASIKSAIPCVASPAIPPTERAAALDRLSRWGVRAIPAEGKVPTRLGTNGKAYNLSPSKFGAIKPEWLESASSLGCSPNGNGVAILDIDSKNCEQYGGVPAVIARLIEQNPELESAYRETTPSGGCHIAIQLPEPLENFKLWRLDPEGPALGEIRGSDTFTAMAPSAGYVIDRDGNPAPVSELRGIYIGPRSKVRAKAVKAKAKAKPKTKPDNLATATATPLTPLISKSTRSILRGQVAEDSDRSESLSALARELLGWEQWLTAAGYIVEGPSAEELYGEAAQLLSVSSDRAQRIWDSLSGEEWEPSLLSAPGSHYSADERCHAKVAAATARAITPKAKPKAKVKVKPKPATIAISADADDVPPAPAPASIYIADDADDVPPGCFEIPEGESAGQVALAQVFDGGEGWANIGGVLHRYAGTHYESVEPAWAKNQISQCLDRAVLLLRSKKGNQIRFPFATASRLHDAYEWVLSKVAFIPVGVTNPTGHINCLNGILKITWAPGNAPDFNYSLLPHTPDIAFTAAPTINYDPEADPAYADQLLQALEPEHREPILRLLASSIDLPKIRALQGRAVRAVFFTGDGENGKDSLRLALTQILGKTGLTSCGLEDFKQYDQGRKFGLAGLAGSRVNWAPENDVSARIDKLQCLKQAVTGDPLQSERKGSQGQDFEPCALFVFNCNGMPNIIGSSRAVASRYAVVPFKKTYSANPSGPNEIKADPRFKNNPEWVAEFVAPSLLNKLLLSLAELAEAGIDYAAFDSALEDSKLESSHVYQWLMEESPLVIDPEGRIESTTLFNCLLDFYNSERLYDLESGRWGADPRPGDPLIKSSKNLTTKLRLYFPKLESKPSHGKRFVYGLRFKTAAELAEAQVQQAQEVSALQHRALRREVLQPTVTDPPALAEALGVGVEALSAAVEAFCTELGPDDEAAQKARTVYLKSETHHAGIAILGCRTWAELDNYWANQSAEFRARVWPALAAANAVAYQHGAKLEATVK